MGDSLQISKVVRFETFELNLKTGELRKGGVKIRLQDQSFQILAALLERPGKMVTREALHERLWPSDTFVDFETGLNIAVSKLRQALGDSADTPRFIETLPRRGYRFVGAIETLDLPGEIVGLPRGTGPERTISHYRILEKLGEGGMGVVHKAEDTKLDRPVAVKFLAPHLLRDEEARKRFEREAKAAARLDHPNICTVYEIDEDGGTTFIVMAFLEGRPLSEKIKEGPLKLSEALSVAAQVAEGLEAAHEKGITHRDIKPDNLMLMKGSRGLVKVMDFGLAQLAGGSKFTGEGTTLGTMSYMSPEQAGGAKTDSSTDIWSLGVVLYEMVAGQRPFRGDYDQVVVYSLMNEEPEPLTALRTGVPKELERIVNKCLAKEEASRYQGVNDLLVDLGELQKEQQADAATRARPAPAPTPQSHRTPWLLAGALVLVALAVGAGAFLGLFESEEPVAQEPLRAVPFTTYPGEETDPDFSPDGEQVVFSWDGEKQDNWDIYVKRLESDTPVRLTSNAASDVSPAWSPDGRWIAFQRWEGGQASVLLIPSIGGPERKVTDLDIDHVVGGEKMAWLPDGTGLIVADGRPLSIFVVSIETGERRELVAAPDVGFLRPNVALSPDGQTLAFIRGESEDRRMQLLDLGADFEPIAPPRMMGSAGLGRTRLLAWSPDGSSLIVGTVRGMTRELGRLSIADPDRIQPLAFAGAGSWGAAVSARANRLVFGRSHLDWNLGVLRKSAAGPEVWQIGSFPSSTRLESGPQFSPDGKQLVFESDRSGNLGIWISQADGSGAKELWVVDGVASGMPRWSPDGWRVAFDSTAGGNFNIQVISSSGGSPLPVTDDPGNEQIPSWSVDGNWVYFSSDRSGRTEIFRILLIHFTLVMNQAILGLALLAAKTESVERRFSKTSGGGSLNGLPASKLAASICSVSAGQRGSFVRTARPRRVGRPDEARCSVAGADARPLPRREPSCTTRGCRCGVGFWPCGWPALRKQG